MASLLESLHLNLEPHLVTFSGLAGDHRCHDLVAKHHQTIEYPNRKIVKLLSWVMALYSLLALLGSFPKALMTQFFRLGKDGMQKGKAVENFHSISSRACIMCEDFDIPTRQKRGEKAPTMPTSTAETHADQTTKQNCIFGFFFVRGSFTLFFLGRKISFFISKSTGILCPKKQDIS